MMRGILCLALGVCLARPAAAGEAIVPVDPELNRPADFNLDVYPILEAKCLACHSRTVHEGDLVLEHVETILKGGGSGPAVIAGNAEESLLLKLCSRTEEPYMPPQPNKAAAMPLTPHELGLIGRWVSEGALPGAAHPASASLAWQRVPADIKAVFSLALSPDERFVAVGRANRVVIDDLTTGQEVTQLIDPALRGVQSSAGEPLYESGVAHLDFVHALAFSPHGDWLASGGYREIKLWQRLRNVQLLQQSTGAGIVAVTVRPDGTQAALVLNDGRVRLWNLASGQPETDLQGFPATCAAFIADGEQLLIGCEDGVIHQLATTDGTAKAQWATGQPVKSLAVSGDGRTAISGHVDGAIRIWTIPDQTPEQPPPPVKEIKDLGGPVLAIQLRPATNEIVAGCGQGEMRRINLDNGQTETSVSIGGNVPAVAISTDGETLAAAAGNLARLTKRGGETIADVQADPELARRAALANDDMTVAKARAGRAENELKQAEKDVAEREASLKKANEARQKADEAVAEPQKKRDEAQEKLNAAQEALNAKPDDEALKKQVEEAQKTLKQEDEALQKAKDAVVSAERAVQLSQQSIETGRQALEQRKTRLAEEQQLVETAQSRLDSANETSQKSASPVRAVSLSPDGKQLATGGDDGVIHLWDAATGRWLESLHGHAGPVRALHYTALGALVSGSDDQQLILWDVKPQWKLAAVLGAKPDNTLDFSESPLVDRVLCLEFSPDGTQLASGGGDPSRSGELLLWDVASQALARSMPDIHSDTVFDVAFSRDGRWLASCAADKFVKVTEVATGKLVRAYEGHTGHVLGVDWMADGGTLVSCGADNSIKLWNVETGEQLRTISNYGKQVTSVACVGIGETIVSGSGDSNVKFHKAGNGGNFRSFGGSTDYVYAVAATDDERLVVAAGEDGIVRVWDGRNGQLKYSFEPPKTDDPPATASR